MLRRPREPTRIRSVRSMRGSLRRGRHRGGGATEQVQISRNVSRTRVASLNVGTLTGRSCELVEALERKRIDLCAVQETRWSYSKSWDIGRGFKVILCVSPRTTSGVGVQTSLLLLNAPQTGCSERAKDEFRTLLDEKTAEVPSEDAVVVAGDLKRHVGTAKDSYSCHGGFGYGARNADGERILEYADFYNLTIANTMFRKRDSHLVSFYSGNTKTQIDFILVKHRDRRLVTDAKVVPYETVATQHRPLICTLKIAPPRLRQVE
ncbi:unnamed protein product [Heligmosomoides polygyrus]|uniref:Endo/exonuclease/phosphatase domain-containing protein n=1 Tax=Heligmosomoides polygyrus TaxID=6339 RepID=A0A183FVN0_HELPZ|nr:unnamed protein product [Heligmosomoides polygyrus]